VCELQLLAVEILLLQRGPRQVSGRFSDREVRRNRTVLLPRQKDVHMQKVRVSFANYGLVSPQRSQLSAHTRSAWRGRSGQML
jgi:hypothetical protein